jgi:hypothetical protein
VLVLQAGTTMHGKKAILKAEKKQKEKRVA